MCEFFDIPTVSYSQVKNKEMIDLYNIADYSRFNDGFKNKLQYYIDYLHTIGIEYNKSNVFFDNVLNNRYTINEGYDKYFSVVSSMKRDKANECYYILKELGKTILRKNGI